MWCKKRFEIILHFLDGMGWHRHGAWVVPTHFIGHLIYIYIYIDALLGCEIGSFTSLSSQSPPLSGVLGATLPGFA